jgi:hypothetical protein
MTKKQHKKYGLLPPKIAESDLGSLDHGLRGTCTSIYNKNTIQNTLFVSMIALIMVDPDIK